MSAPFSHQDHTYPSKVDVVLANLIEAEKRRASISYWLSEGATGERFTNGDPAAEITRTTQEITKLRYELDQALCSAALAETYRPSPTSAAVIETMCRRLKNNGSVRQIEVRSARLPAVVSPAGAM
jgi:hypothetical protein